MTDLGTDVSCVFDATPNMAMVSGRRCLAEAVARRLITPRGRLIGSPNYGFDLTQYLNDDLTAGDLIRIAAGATSEVKNDERVLAATVSIALAFGVMTVKVLLEDASGPFTLVLSISDVTVEILKIA